jgi:hypothetical protein
MTIDQLIDSLTYSQAVELENQTDRLIWIEVNLLDPANLSRNFAAKVDAVLDEMYCEFWNECSYEQTADRVYSN